jgi:hypothetical protein
MPVTEKKSKPLMSSKQKALLGRSFEGQFTEDELDRIFIPLEKCGGHSSERTVFHTEEIQIVGYY